MKNRFFAGLGISTLLLGGGCRWAQKELAPAPPLVSNATDDNRRTTPPTTGCLDDTGTVISEYFSLGGQERLEPLLRALDCAGQMIQLFSERIQGSTDGVYQLSELRNFIQTYFLKRSKISDGYYAEILALKRAIVGGNTETLTRAEIRRTQNILEYLKSAATRMAPYFPMGESSARKWSTERLQTAQVELKAVAAEFGQILSTTAQEYSFAHLQTLLEEFSSLPEFSNPQDLIPSLRKRLAWMRAIKGVLVDSEMDVVRPNTWEILLRVGAESYLLYLQYAHLESNYPSWSRGEGRVLWSNTLHRFLNLLKDAASRQPDHSISFQFLDPFIEEAPFEVPLQKPTLRRILRPLVYRILPLKRDAITPERLSLSNIQRIEELVSMWEQFQIALDTGKAPDLQEYPEARAFWNELKNARQWNRWKFDADGVIQTPALGPSPDQTVTDLSTKAWILIATRNLARAYGDLRRRVDWNSFQEMIHDLAPALVDLHILHPQWDPTFLSGQFEQMDIVHNPSDGDGWVNEAELFHHLSTVLSMSAWSAKIATPLFERCSSAHCARWTFFAGIEEHWKTFPDLRADYLARPLSEQAEYNELLERIATNRMSGPLVSEWQPSTLQAMGMVVHYVEYLYQRFDLNQDGRINEKELIATDSILARFIQKAIRQATHSPIREDSPRILHNVASFVLANARVPSMAELLGWMMLPPLRNRVHADRLQLLRAIVGAAKGAS